MSDDKRSDVKPSANAEREHVTGPESGPDADAPMKPGAHSGSGDVERAQRDDAMDGGEGTAQAARILRRNKDLVEGDAEGTAEGEEQIAGVRTETSDAHGGAARGDYGND
jgi:hypothetical protein